jgi:hypothetical protein
MADITGDMQSLGVTNPSDLIRVIIGRGFSPEQAAAIASDMKAPKPGYTPGEEPSPAQDSWPSRTTTTGTRQQIKQFAPGTIEDVKSKASAVDSIIQSTTPMVNAILGDLQTASAQARQATEATAVAAASKVGAQSEATVQKLEQDSRIATMLGLNADGGTPFLEAQLAKWSAADEKVQTAKPIIDQLTSINPFTDPVKWLFAQIQLTSAVPAYNAEVQNRDSASQAIALRSELETKLKSNIPAMTVESVKKQAIAESEIAAAQATITSYKLKEQAATLTMQAVNEQIRWNQGAAQLSVDQARLLLQNLGISAEEKLAKEDQAETDRANLVRISFGAEPITNKQFKQLPPDQREMLLNASVGKTTLADSMMLIQKLGTPRTLASQSPTMAKTYWNIVNSIEPVYAKMNKDLGDKRSQDEKMRAAISVKDKQWRDEVATGDYTAASPDNPYKMAPREYAAAPELKDNLVAKWVNTGGLNGQPQDNLSEKEVLTFLAAQAKVPGVNLDQVAEQGAQFFKIGQEYQYKSRKMGTLGFDKPLIDGKLSYPMNTTPMTEGLTGFMRKPDYVNGADPTALKHFILKSYAETVTARQSQLEARTGLNPSSFTFGQ